MAPRRSKPPRGKIVETIKHLDASRKNIPTVEYEPTIEDDDRTPIRVAYQRRNRDLDPQLVWRGKDEQDESDLYAWAPPLYIQEKVHPKVLVDDLIRMSGKEDSQSTQLDLFADFNGIPEGAYRTEFYQHDANWTNRMILGDSLQVMASMGQKEGMRGKFQCIYIDPPYGIKFNSNFQWSTTSRIVTDGKAEHMTREPEQVKAFRDTWRDGIHTYLSYLRDRLTVARDLLAESGSVFVQIGDENAHRVRSLMDEVFGDQNFVAMIFFQTAANQNTNRIQRVYDVLLWYKAEGTLKFREIFRDREPHEIDGVFTTTDDISGQRYKPTQIKSSEQRAAIFRAGRLSPSGTYWKRFFTDFPYVRYDNVWKGTVESTFSKDKSYVVQTNRRVIERCLLMTTDPGDLVLDPTCGSGTTAYVAEHWGRRWITIDTSKVALALARARLMGARYPYYILKDSKQGQIKEAELTRTQPSMLPTYDNINHGFVYERLPHITLGTIVNNTEIDVIWELYQEVLGPLREKLNDALGESWEEGEVPREMDDSWSTDAKWLHTEWWENRTARQTEIDASIASKAEFEYLYDKPYEDNRKVRVAGPFTVESASPVRSLDQDEHDVPIIRDVSSNGGNGTTGVGDGLAEHKDFVNTVLQTLRVSGVQQSHKEDRITLTSLDGFPGAMICASGTYVEGDLETGQERAAGIFIGPEFGPVTRADLVEAARETADCGFDVLVACGFSYEVHAQELSRLGKVPILKATMNADLHMAGELKDTGSGNLFVVFGEPEIEIEDAPEGKIQVRIKGVDIFKPATGEVVNSEPDDIALWFVDTDYDNESFFVRQAYFLGARDPYRSLKTTLRAEINKEAWESLHSEVSRPFDRPDGGRIAVKVINHLGDEVMKVYRV